MILGLYFFVLCVVVGGKITAIGVDDIERIDEHSTCESRFLMPEWMFKYIGMMIRSGHEKKLGIFLIVGLVLYAILVVLMSWLFGLVLFRSTEHPGLVFGYGFALYLIIEFTIGIILLLYWFIQSLVLSMKKMSDLEIAFTTRLSDDFGYDDNTKDKVTKILNAVPTMNKQ
jgi:hypothetical protein